MNFLPHHKLTLLLNSSFLTQYSFVLLPNNSERAQNFLKEFSVIYSHISWHKQVITLGIPTVSEFSLFGATIFSWSSFILKAYIKQTRYDNISTKVATLGDLKVSLVIIC